MIYKSISINHLLTILSQINFDGVLFHSAVARYMEHDFKTVYLTNSSENGFIEFPIGIHTDSDHLFLVPKEVDCLVNQVKLICDNIVSK